MSSVVLSLRYKFAHFSLLAAQADPLHCRTVPHGMALTAVDGTPHLALSCQLLNGKCYVTVM